MSIGLEAMRWLSVAVTFASGGVAVALLSNQRIDFWAAYARAGALCALPCLGWLVFKAGSATGSWWGSAPAVALVAAIVGAIAPATTFIVSWAKIRLDDKRQQHEITSDYLNRALDAEQPIATRHQLLRFLSTAPQQGDRLHGWAKEELKRIGPAFEQQSKDLQQAQQEIAAAKSPTQLQLAEEKLRAVVGRTEGKPPLPDVTPAALRAGMFVYKNVGSIDLSNQNLAHGNLQGIKMVGCKMTGAKLFQVVLHAADLRRANLDGADLNGADLSTADLRGASFVGANLTDANIQLAHVEGCDFTGALLEDASLIACYDDSTKWPDGFDPVAAGCISTQAQASRES